VVTFQPLDSLYGAYLGIEGTNGILINANHPPNLQRFTAAHEYGHFIMQHGPSADKEEQILSSRQTYNWQEVEAQTFAAHFLMPLQAVNTGLHHLGLPLKPEKMMPESLYRLSLDLEVSYAAVINHLVSLGKLNPHVAEELRARTPKAIKAALGGGVGPQNSWADVWTFTTRDAGREIYVYVDDELHIYLPESTADNHEWMMASPFVTDHIVLRMSDLRLAQPLEQHEEEQLECTRHFVFRAQSPGHVSLRLENQGSPPDIFELRVHILRRQVQGLLL